MKKMKGVALPPLPPHVEYPPYALFEDQRNRFKHQSLLQDYEELQKETDTMKQKLHMMKERKSMLLAEVRFLKRRHDFLIQNKPSTTPLMERNQGKVLGIKKSKTVKKGKNNKKEPTLKGKLPALKGKEASSRFPTPLLELNQMQPKASVAKELTLMISKAGHEFDQKERVFSGKEATSHGIKPAFDLNQISVEEEELQASDDPLKTDEMKKNSSRIGSEEQQNDVKLSVCRSTGSVQSRAGKRKITWQDPVALRV